MIPKHIMERVERDLCKESGLKGLSGVSNDIRDIQAEALKGNAKAKLAIDVFVHQARHWIGRGIDSVDTSGLTFASRKEKPGILEQTLISAFPSRAAAEFARDFVIKHSRVVPKQSDIVEPHHSDELRVLVPEDFVAQASKALDGGHALLILRVDETQAFRVRELLDEDTRSEWTLTAPPQLIAAATD